jgi:glucose-6-phosphate dehydrogenase assembly protein OpcA
VAEEIWSERETTPARVEEALREMLNRRSAASDGAFAPARVLNLVVVVDAAFRGEVENRLERVGRYHPSRTVVCAVHDGRTALDAWATLSFDDAVPSPGHLSIIRERVEMEMGPQHVRGLASIVVPLLVSDLTTLVWTPHGHDEAVQALRSHAQILLVDSMHETELETALGKAEEWSSDLYVVDLAWLRSTPWRERVAAAFDPPGQRRALSAISRVVVRHREDSKASAALFCGWLASRLGWRPEHLLAQQGCLVGRARARRGEVEIRLEPAELSSPGLGGVTIELASGEAVSLDRAPGGLTEVRRARDGSQRTWTVLGASRGEGGILGEGVRQALLRDPAYRPALRCAQAMVGR